MTALPPSSDFVTTGQTKATFKAALTNLRSYLSGLFGDTGTQGAALTALGAPLNGVLAKSGAYTVVAADRGKLISCTGTWTLAIDAVATLGAGFVFGYRNDGSGIITINPNLSEQIDGVSNLAIAPGESGFVVVEGAALKTVSRIVTPPDAAIRQVVSASIAAATGTTLIPDDTTAPLSTEGTQIASLSITPVSVGNAVRVRANLIVGVGNAVAIDGGVIVACFRGATLVGAKRLYLRGNNGATQVWGFMGDVALEFVDSPASISSQTYSLRVGIFNSGDGISWFVNRSEASATALASSMASSRFTAEELSA